MPFGERETITRHGTVLLEATAPVDTYQRRNLVRPFASGICHQRRLIQIRLASAVPRSLIGMKVFGITGHSGMGKTTLLERLIPELARRGHSVSLIKHSHKDIDIDRPGKDSYRLREAGCKEVLLLGNGRWALMHELRGAGEPSLSELIGKLDDCSLVLVEGFKSESFPKIEVWRDELGKSPLWQSSSDIFAVATDAELQAPHPKQFDLQDTVAIAEFVEARAAVVS